MIQLVLVFPGLESKKYREVYVHILNIMNYLCEIYKIDLSFFAPKGEDAVKMSRISFNTGIVHSVPTVHVVTTVSIFP